MKSQRTETNDSFRVLSAEEISAVAGGRGGVAVSGGNGGVGGSATFWVGPVSSPFNID